ncbi:Tryptophan synthase beta chain [Candidatus Lokiarchaeum ossiferum]|uniref:Multifunctional fusion protein n=1 Tax=Candidatus Lokiarchaeum ossiferum TaxID=2951803 RepID=A0ABY6HU39_9ARCH|nr:Tryptophan synthase beta chain [Candidatus Lokiarchaeum sp. B-35]
MEIAESRKQDIPTIRTILENPAIDSKLSGSNKRDRFTLANILRNRQNLGLITELKPASPSRGSLLPLNEFQEHIPEASIQEKILFPTVKNIRKMTKEMIAGGAIAISVLVEPRKFKGSFGNLSLVAENTPRTIPIILKDFNISKAQLELGKQCGASNALLITSICDPVEMFYLMHEVGLEPLVEIHDEKDLEKIRPLQFAREPFVIGINNRNLKDLTTDLKHTFNLVLKVRKIFGESQPIITESGINLRNHVLKMESLGIFAALVGTAIMSGSITEKMEELTGNNHTFLKICGMTDYHILGKIKYPSISAFGTILDIPSSKRNLKIDETIEIHANIPENKLKVLVLKDKNLKEIKKIDSIVKPDFLQIHISKNALQLKDFPLYLLRKMIHPMNIKNSALSEVFNEIRSLPSEIFAILLDSSNGRGKILDLERTQQILKQIPNRRFIVAGGIGTNNIGTILTTLDPFGIDISSALEMDGKKNKQRVANFMEEFTKTQRQKTKEKCCFSSYKTQFPDRHGKFGRFGGKFVPETLIPAINELEREYCRYKEDPAFIKELNQIRSNYMGRPTPLSFSKNLSKKFGCKIYLKREDLLHGGAHKLNNVMGQALLAKKMGKTKLVAETGAGQHGFATSIAGAYFGMKTTIFMGAIDMQRQKYNVSRMKMLGATVIPVTSGTQTLKDAVNAGLQYWIANLGDTHYLMGSVVGPHPYPMMVRDFQKVIGEEIHSQIKFFEGRLPDKIVACVGGGSNAMGAFYEFIDKEEVELWGVEAAGKGSQTDHHALALQKGTDGILHGARQLLIQDENRNIQESYSISAGLDYPGVGPELCYLKAINRLKLSYITDTEAIDACLTLTHTEGIIPALESSHAIAFGLQIAEKMTPNEILVINLSGHGGKDIETLMQNMEKTSHE